MKKESLPKSFITQASAILADTEKGLSGPKIVELSNAFAFDFDINIPHSSYPTDTPNKRTALADNLMAFGIEQQKKIILDLCDHPNVNNQREVKRLRKRLLEKYSMPVSTTISIDDIEFLQKDFNRIDKSIENLDIDIQDVIRQRVNEINNCLNYDLPLASIFLTASTLEGLLFDLAKEKVEVFVKCKSAPKYKGKVLELDKWRLNNLLNAASELEYISQNSYKWSKDLKGIRNFIHPREQVKNNYNPNMRSAKIAFQVLMSVIEDLDKNKKSNE